MKTMKTMKTLGLFVCAALAIVSCGTAKRNAVESRIEKGTSLEGEKVVVETVKLQGIDMIDDLSDDGTKMVKVAFKWYAGVGKANDKQAAIEMSELEARATISRILENAVLAESERGNVINNGDVQKALTSHWKQVSTSIQNACEPLGDTKIEYSPSSGMYSITSKVGIRGDRFQQLLNNAGNYKPSNLSGKDLEDFIKANKSIMNTAKGN